MERESKVIYGVSESTGVLRIFKSVYAAAKELGVTPPSITQAVSRIGGTCKGVQLYESVDDMREKAKRLEEAIGMLTDLIMEGAEYDTSE